jgi:hypothetical protein
VPVPRQVGEPAVPVQAVDNGASHSLWVGGGEKQPAPRSHGPVDVTQHVCLHPHITPGEPVLE